MQQLHPVPPPDLCPFRGNETPRDRSIATVRIADNVELQPPDAGQFARLRSDCADVHGQFGSEYQADSTQLFGLGGYATTGDNPDGQAANPGRCGASFAVNVCRSDRLGAVDRGAAAASGSTGADHDAAAAGVEPGGSGRPELAPPAAELIDEPDDDEPEIERELTEDDIQQMFGDWVRECRGFGA